MKQLCFLTFLILGFSRISAAEQIVENFSSRTMWDSSSTAVWNQELGKSHPSLQVVNYKTGYTTPLPFSVGDGSHGAFELSTYAQFSENGDLSGNKIRLNLSRFPVLKVTRFHLEAGWILEPIGSSPLIIQSLSTVKIDGSIWCQGQNGSTAVSATPGSGGQGRCGGGAGGDGGSVNQDGASGTSTHGSVTGGSGGVNTGGAAVGGGGGGSWNTSTLATAGAHSAVGAGGQRGNSLNDPEFTIEGGGAGGGGGSGTATEAGSGGGGGGGAVLIHAVGNVQFGTAGFIDARGGTGGGSLTGPASGAGGGGGGGSVKIFSGASLLSSNPGNSSLALAGSGGQNSLAEAGGNGGKGRSWYASVGYIFSGVYNPPEGAPLTPNTNTVAFSNSPQTIITQAYDLQSTLTTISDLQLSPISNDFQIEINGSSDNFQSDETGWTSNPSLVSNKRYLKLRATLTTSTPYNPTLLDQMQFSVERHDRKDFQFQTSGCGLLSGGPPDNVRWWHLIFLLGPLAFWLRRRLELHFNRHLTEFAIQTSHFQLWPPGVQKEIDRPPHRHPTHDHQTLAQNRDKASLPKGLQTLRESQTEKQNRRPHQK